jgi:hypothetical protein
VQVGGQAGQGGKGELRVGEELFADAARLVAEHVEMDGGVGKRRLRGDAAIDDELGRRQVGGDEMEGDEAVGGAPAVGGAERAFGAEVFVGRERRRPIAAEVPP